MEIFISHSSKDRKYGQVLVQLLIDIGINQNDIIFTSKQGHGIPKGQNIFQWLKSKLTSSPFVIYLLSENYYSSIPCLNEMGAAWVIENDHLTFIMPGFEIKNQNFMEGAIDPREMVIFADKKHDIFEFIDIINNKLNLKPSSLQINEAVSRYIKSVNEVYLEVETCDESKIDEKVDEKITYSDFETAISENNLTEEELLLIRYMSDEGKFTLGHRWMEDGEIQNIKQWESNSGIKNKLSLNYSKALGRFITRDYLDVHSTTSYGNPREYILNKSISKGILTLGGIVKDTTDKVIKENEITLEDLF